MRNAGNVYAVVCAVLCASRAFGADITWTGDGNDGVWSTGANWINLQNNAAGTPGAGDSAIFNSSGGTITVAVNDTRTVQQIRVLGSASVVVNIANGMVLTVANNGAQGLQANGADLTFNGPGQLGLSTAEGAGSQGVNHLDNGADFGRTLAIYAKIVGNNGGQTGFETWLANNGKGGDVILGYTANDFTMNMNLGAGHTVIASKLAPAGQPSCLGAITNIMPSRGGVIRYTGTGDTAGYAFRLNGGDAVLGYGGGIAQDGTGPLLWTGNIYNENNNVQTFTLLGDSASPATITGDIYNNQGTLAIVKNGSGTWILSGNNTFTGGLTVNAGTLGLTSASAAGNVTQITMTSGATLTVNPSATDGFVATFPGITASGNVALTIPDAPSASTVTFNGLGGTGSFSITAPGAGTPANRIFIPGLAPGLQGSWLSLNGGTAQYDHINGLAPASVTTQGLATKGSTLPNGVGIQADINTVGTGGPIALPANPTALYSLTLTANDDAAVDTAGKTLLVGEIVNATATNALTLGVSPQDGTLLRQASSIVIPDSTAISNLNPIIWYDPSEAANVGVYLGAVTNLVNKGIGGPALNAAVRSGWTGPPYVTGNASHSALPMFKIDSNTQGLQSLANTGISGKAARTLVTVMSRNPGQECIVSIGAASGRLAFENYLRNDWTRFGTYSGDIDMPVSPAETPIVMAFLNGYNADPNTFQGWADGIAAANGPRTEGDLNTTDTPLHLGHRNGGHSNNYRGQIGEVLLFNYTLSDLQRQTVEAYLIAKWKQAKPSVLSSAISLRNDSTAPLTVNAAITEPNDNIVSLVKAGPGDVVLAGGLTLSGFMLLDDGTLTVGTPLGLIDTLSGVISGPGRLAKDGPGTLFLPPAVANLYTGGTDISDGTVIVGNSRSFGMGAIAIADGATLDIGGGLTAESIAINNPITVSGAGADGLGAIVHNGQVTQRNAFQNTTVQLLGDAAIGGTFASRWDIAGATAFLDLNGHILTKLGVTDFRISPANITNAPAGKAFDIQQGSLGVETSTTFHPNDALREIHIADGGRFGMYNLTTPVNWTVILADGADIWAYGSDEYINKNVITSDIVLPGILHLTSAGSYAKNLSGVLSGPGGLSVHDGGLRALSLISNPANTFQGPVAVSNAILGLRYPGSLPGGIAAIPSKLSLANTGGVRIYANPADGWTDGEITQLAQSGIFNSTAADNQRLQIEVPPGLSASLPALGSSFVGDIDKLGRGALSFDGSLTRVNANTRSFAGTLVMTNVATFDMLGNNLYLGDGALNDGTGGDCAMIIGGDATLTSNDNGYNTPGPALRIASHNSRVTLDMDGNADVTAKFILGGWDAGDTTAYGAVYQSGNARWLSTGGAGNDSIIGRYGYGYWQLDGGDLTMKGFSILGYANNDFSVGILRQTGGAITFNGQRDALPAQFAVTDSYGGELDLSRGGKADFYTSGGTFTHYGNLKILSVNNGSDTSVANGNAVMTITGTADVMIDRQIEMGDRNNGFSALNLNGGKLATTYIRRVNRNNSPAFLNFNGGTLSVTNNTNQQRLFVVDNADNAPLNTYIYAGGATIETGPDIRRTIDIPLQGVIGGGLASIAIANGGSGYLAPPHVSISGGSGTGATAIAHIDRTSGQVTSIEITCPGQGYITEPTVTLTGGGGTGVTFGLFARADNGEGGLTKTGPGILTLNAPNTYRGPTCVEDGTLVLAHPEAIHPQSEIIIHDGTLDLGGNTVTARSVTITGSGTIINGKIITGSAVKTGPGAATWGAEIALAPVTETIPGLWEGMIRGNNTTVGTPGYYWDITSPNPQSSIQLTTRAANDGVQAGNGGYAGGLWSGNNHTWIYSGYIWNREDHDVTWTFYGRFDDNIRLAIDDIQLFNVGGNGAETFVSYTLTPGPHSFDARFGDGGGEVGPGPKDRTLFPAIGPMGGLLVDYSGGGTPPLDPNNTNLRDLTNFQILEDPGNGLLFTATRGITEPESAIRVEGGTLTFSGAIEQEAGLWETRLSGNFNLTDRNDSTTVELTTTAANGYASAVDIPINGKPWPANATYVYTGYIWNRTGAPATWTFAEHFDDNIYLVIGETVVLSNMTWNVPSIGTITLDPGPHPFEVRFGQGTGGVGAPPNADTSASWWGNFNAISGFAIDFGGHDTENIAYFVKLEDPGNGSLLTRSIRYANTNAPGVPVDVFNGATIDFGGTGQSGLILSPAGDDDTGAMGIDGLFNGSLNGVTYLLTVHDFPPSYYVNTPGLWEGHLYSNWDPTTPNPMDGGIHLTTRAGNLPYGGNSTSPRDVFWGGGNNTWVYTGFIWNNEGHDVTWTWRFNFDDDVALWIDNKLVKATTWAALEYKDYTLTPGPHPIEIRFGDGAGNVGAANTPEATVPYGGLMYTTVLGSTDVNDYLLLEDPGNGSLLTTTAHIFNGYVNDVITAAAGPVNLNGLTVKPSDALSVSPPGNNYVIGYSPGGFIGTAAIEGFEGKKWKVMRKGNQLLLTTQGGTVMILR